MYTSHLRSIFIHSWLAGGLVLGTTVQAEPGGVPGEIRELQHQVSTLQSQVTVLEGQVQRADPPCFALYDRYADCGNGTVTDSVTGLIWLKQADCLPVDLWVVANTAAAGLKRGDCGLTDHSSAGDWRLPTKDEWNVTIAQASIGGLQCQVVSMLTLTNTPGTACYETGPEQFSGVQAHYWSSSTFAPSPHGAWSANLFTGGTDLDDKTFGRGAWPVRAGR